MDAATANYWFIVRSILIWHCAAYWYKYQRKKLQSKKRRFAVRPVLKKRDTHGEFANFFTEIKYGDDEIFFQYTRMTRRTYDVLLALVGHKLQKNCNTCRRIPAEQRLAFTLRYLSTGDAQISCSWSYRIGRSTASSIIRETCNAIWTVLHPLVLPPPTKNDWKRIAEDFYLHWNFPNCCGSIDGKYVYLQAPPNSGSTFFCHKKMFAIVLMAICDSRYKFLWVDIGAPGSESDGGVLQRSELGLAMHNHILNLPESSYLPNSPILFPHFFVGDEAFALGSSLMRPYPGHFLPNQKKVFNYRLSRARRTIENSFGILVARWRILKKPIQASLETTKSVTKACICLHNFIMMSPDSSTYCPASLIAMTNTIQWAKEMEECALGRLQVGEEDEDLEPSHLRDTLANYVMTTGRVPWQQERVTRGRNPHFVG